jgi:hypothetical protein
MDQPAEATASREVIEYQNARLELDGPLATFWFNDPEC